MQVVWVTQDDIANGVPGVGNECPIARAMKRAFVDAKSVWVSPEWITVVKESGTILVDQRVNEVQRTFIELFDAREEVGPIPIEIEEP